VIDPGFAPAKVNLYLHVGPLDADGYHPLSSLVVFAGVGDRVRLAPAAADSFLVEGPFAKTLAGEQDNLVLRALRRLEAATGGSLPPLHITLDKALPVAAGLGGGSSDAAAALRLARRMLRLPIDDQGLAEVAAGVGADGPMCLRAAPCIAEGRGERLSEAPELPELHAVLVNPGAPSPTGAVYRAYDEAGAPGGADRPVLPPAFESVEALAEALADCRNDLEAPAVRLTPVIGEVLDVLRAAPETLLARMSGSGATCFSLCVGATAAAELADRLRSERRGWWVRACRLGGSVAT